MKIITLKIFSNLIDAQLLKSKLESEGIHSIILNELTASLSPINNHHTDGIKLQILDSDTEKCIEILSEIENTNYTNENGEDITCPNCSSTELISGFNSIRGLKGFKAFLILASALLLGSIIVKQESVYKCKNCDAEF